jgi:hypothetical protein
MRYSRFAVVWLGCALGYAAVEPSGGRAHVVAIVLKTEAPMSPMTEQAMREELARLLRPAGIRAVVHRDAEMLDLGGVDEVIWVGYRGCSLVPAGKAVSRPAGPLGWVRCLDGAMQPFVTVDCPLVAAHLREALVAPQHLWAKPLMGRALARVLVHELMHYLTRSREHSGTRLFREDMDSQTLVEPRVALEAVDLEALRRTLTH